MVRLVSVLVVLTLSFGCKRHAGAHHATVGGSFSGNTMGSTYEVKFSGETPTAQALAAVDVELDMFDQAFSNWRDDSEIARVNAHDSTDPIEVSDRFASVLATALRIAEATGGAFDPTVKPFSDLYRRAKKDPAAGISAADVEAARRRIGYRLIGLDGNRVTKARPDVQLDLDGLVAGAAVDAIAKRLDDLGVRSFYIEVTGEVFCRGLKSNGEPWRIGVVDPESDVTGGNRALRTVALTDRALCTSGDYRNATIVDGEVVHHVFDPRTGDNPQHSVVSASVLARSCAVADALGTAIMVLGDDGTKRLWPELQKLGAHGALLLKPGEDETFAQVEIEWPDEGM